MKYTHHTHKIYTVYSISWLCGAGIGSTLLVKYDFSPSSRTGGWMACIGHLFEFIMQTAFRVGADDVPIYSK